MIILQNVSRSYSIGGTEVHALAGVDLEVGRGEFVAVMGQSGSGKTTMMNIIGLLDRPSGGRYVFAGHDVSQLPENTRARLRGQAFGFVFQSYNLLPRLNALEQVELPLIYQGVRNRRRRAAEALDRVWASWTASPISQRNSRVASNSGSPLRGRWFPTRWYCWPTNPQGHWIRRQGAT